MEEAADEDSLNSDSVHVNIDESSVRPAQRSPPQFATTTQTQTQTQTQQQAPSGQSRAAMELAWLAQGQQRDSRHSMPSSREASRHSIQSNQSNASMLSAASSGGSPDFSSMKCVL
jgi:hypothetical protein